MFDFKQKQLSKFNLLFVISLIIYLSLGIYLIRYYQYDPISRDLISIISIARIYASGDLINAINGYWGPMFSWMLVPIIINHPTPQFTLFSTKVLALIIGFFTLIGIKLLSNRFELSEPLKIAFLYLSIFILLYFAYRFNPVDLLLACFLLYYLYFLFSPDYSLSWYSGMICGHLGALAYLTKSYALPFFLVSFVLFNLIHYFNDLNQRKGLFKNFLLGLTVFFILTGFWAGVISEKYGYLTFGTSGQYNLNEIGPIQHKMGSPIWHGFIGPPNEKASSAWEDPTYLKVRSWSPLESWSFFKYENNIIKDNIIKTMAFLNEFSYLSLLIILFYLMLIVKSIKRLFKVDNSSITYPFIILIIYVAFYILIFVEFRYLYLVYFLLILMGGYLMQQLFKKQFCSAEIKFILPAVFIISLLIVPVTALTQDINSGKGTYDLANTLNNHYHIKGNIASNDGYMASLYVTYLWDTQYYGTSLKNWTTISDQKLERDLKEYDIDYYLYWDDSNYNSQLLSNYKEITGGKIKDLKIYSIKERISY